LIKFGESFAMRTITVRLQNDRDADLLMDLLRTAKFQSGIETFLEEEVIDDDELQLLNERVEEYRKDPSKAKNLNEVRDLLNRKYGI
jgi:hypothetical protein